MKVWPALGSVPVRSTRARKPFRLALAVAPVELLTDSRATGGVPSGEFVVWVTSSEIEKFGTASRANTA